MLNHIDIVFGYLTSPERMASESDSRGRIVVAEEEFGAGPEGVSAIGPTGPAEDQRCTGPFEQIECLVASYERHLQRQKKFDPPETDGRPANKPSKPYRFLGSAAARAIRVDILERMDRLLPTLGQMTGEESLSNEQDELVTLLTLGNGRAVAPVFPRRRRLDNGVVVRAGV